MASISSSKPLLNINALDGYPGKRAFDVIFGFALLVASSPLLLMAGIGILLSSPGPIFYRGDRVGRAAQPFKMLKLRTMIVDADKGSRLTARRDSRIFPFGAFLRASKIDELPQLLNILRGDMSFVGPRPEDPTLVAKHYSDAMTQTLAWRPGLTCAGTILYMTDLYRDVPENGSSEIYREKVLSPKLAADLAYMKRESLWGDVRIIVGTAYYVVRNTFLRSYL